MRSEHVPVSPALSRYVDRIWAWQGRPDELPTLLPGTGAELVLQHGSPVVAGTRLGPRELPAAHLLCLRRDRWPLTAGGPVRFTAVRFRAGGLARFCPVPATELADQVVPAADLFGAELFGAELFGTLSMDGSLAHRAARLQWVLTKVLDRPTDHDPRVAAAVRRVYRDPAAGGVERLGAAVGLSTRHLRRGFLATVGVGPKEFQRLARFQRVARALLLSAPVAQLPAALAAGYYDQSHYIKEFRRIAGQPPTELLRRPVSHFYYPSLAGTGDPGRHDRRSCDSEGHTRTGR
jgi:AraC-like DNA-binding protein